MFVVRADEIFCCVLFTDSYIWWREQVLDGFITFLLRRKIVMCHFWAVTGTNKCHCYKRGKTMREKQANKIMQCVNTAFFRWNSENNVVISSIEQEDLLNIHKKMSPSLSLNIFGTFKESGVWIFWSKFEFFGSLLSEHQSRQKGGGGTSAG